MVSLLINEDSYIHGSATSFGPLTRFEVYVVTVCFEGRSFWEDGVTLCTGSLLWTDGATLGNVAGLLFSAHSPSISSTDSFLAASDSDCRFYSILWYCCSTCYKDLFSQNIHWDAEVIRSHSEYNNIMYHSSSKKTGYLSGKSVATRKLTGKNMKLRQTHYYRDIKVKVQGDTSPAEVTNCYEQRAAFPHSLLGLIIKW